MATVDASSPRRTGTSDVPDIDRGVLRAGLSRLWRNAMSRKGLFGIAVAGGIVHAILQVLTADVLGAVTDRVIVPSFATGDPALGIVVAGGLALLGIAILRGVAVAVRRSTTNLTVFTVAMDTRLKLSAKLSELPLMWHRRQSTGSLLSNVYSDVDAMMYSMNPFPFAISTVFMLVYAAITVALIDPVLLTVMLAVFPVLVVLNLWFQRVARPVATRSQQLRAEVSEIAHESFDGAGVIKTLGREDVETARFTDATERLRRNGIRFGNLRGWFDPLIETLPNLGILAVILLGAVRIRDGALSTADLVQVSYLFTLMALPIRSFGWVLGDLSRTVVGWGRIRRVLHTPDRLDYGAARLPAAPAAPAAPATPAAPAADRPQRSVGTGPGGREPARLDVENVTLEYRDSLAGGDTPRPDTVALRGASFTVDPATARTVALVGATGSGKSSLTLLLARLLDPSGGRILLDGVDLRDLAADELARHTALVLQHAFLFDDTVRHNVTLGDPIDDDTVRWALRVAQADGFVAELPEGLDTVLGERGGSLSGGQRQRIALARALARRPRLLVLDDATSAVDPSVEARILDGIRREITDATVIVVAYRKATIAIADHVVLLEDGRVTAEGTHAELSATNSGYAALVNAYDEAAIAHELLEGGEGVDDDRHGSDRHGNDRHRSDRHGNDRHRSDRHRSDRHGRDRHGTDGHGSGQDRADRPTEPLPGHEEPDDPQLERPGYAPDPRRHARTLTERTITRHAGRDEDERREEEEQ